MKQREKQMQYALVVFEMPYVPKEGPKETDETRKWTGLSDNLEKKAAGIAGILKLSANVYQIPLDRGLPFLAECISGAAGQQIRYCVHFFEDAPLWFGPCAPTTPSPE